MKIRPLLVVVSSVALTFFVLLCSVPGWSTDARDGTIVKSEACKMTPLTHAQDLENIKKTYESESAVARGRGLTPLPFDQLPEPTEATWTLIRAHEGFECRQIRYMSDGLEISAFLYKPVHTNGRRLPVVIINRGGSRDLGAWDPWGFTRSAYEYGNAGFVVLASQYRGGGGSQGEDEFGGADVDDVLNLITAAKSLNYADSGNIFMAGASRGGMMTCLAIRRKAPIRAAFIVSGMFDLEENARDRPEMKRNFQQMIPGFREHEAERYRDRSAVYWAQEITVPVLILHGTADWRVDVSQALAFAQELQRQKKTYELMIFPNDSHGVPVYRRPSTSIEWFKKFMQ